MFIAAIIAVLILSTILFGLIRAWLGKYTVHPLDWINFMFSIPFTFLLVYYNVI